MKKALTLIILIPVIIGALALMGITKLFDYLTE